MSWTTSAPSGAARLELGAAGAHQRVDDRLEHACARLGSAKTIAPDRRPVELALGRQHPRAERLDHLGEARRARRDHLAGQQVGVDHHRTELGEDRRHRALARGHAAGQSHPHAGTVATGSAAGARIRRPGCEHACMELIDLSHVVEDGMVTYPGLPAPQITEHLSFDDSHDAYATGTEFAIGRITMVANTGTYLDTPAHRYRGADDLSRLPLERCALLPGMVVDGRTRHRPRRRRGPRTSRVVPSC